MPTTISCPLANLRAWIEDEKASGTAFAHGAVLATTSSKGECHSRMLGVQFDLNGQPKFHTTPPSRKTNDIAQNASASLTFGWHSSLRSVSLEGQLAALSAAELDEDWPTLDTEFRRSYHVFGPCSGALRTLSNTLEQQRAALPLHIENQRPASFIGFKFAQISRIAFYAVGQEPFATHRVFTRNGSDKDWIITDVVP